MKKYFVVEIEEDIDLRGFIVESAEVMCAKSENEIIEFLKTSIGENLVTYSIRPATWKERREYKKAHREPCLSI